MSDLTAFLTARLDEDEAAAKAATHEPWHASATTDDPPRSVIYVNLPQHGNAARVLFEADWGNDEDADHVARHDPARVLREVAAKRAILAEHDTGAWAIGDRFHDCQWLKWPCPTLRLLAAVYADHPDFDPAWVTA